MELTGEMIMKLNDFVGNDPDASVTLSVGLGYHGEGIYAWLSDYPDEGSIFLGE